MARFGFARIDFIVFLVVCTIFALIGSPVLLAMRERARAQTCANNLRQVGAALHVYHDAFKSLPPAALWRTDRTQSIALHVSERMDLFTGSNWVQLMLPQLGEEVLAEKFDPDHPVADSRNEIARTTRLSVFVCPSDPFNNKENTYRYQFDRQMAPIAFARGNYAINGGSQNHRPLPGNSARPVVDGPLLVMDQVAREFRFVGTGVAGINVAFSFSDFANGLATTVAVDEIRSGIHPIDPRGVWALGQIASSITWAHGINGDDGKPNEQWERSDDLLFGSRINEVVGKEILARERMPCVSYVNHNEQATARSLHPGGVHVLFADGHTQFIKDSIEPSLWHVMHSRETPKEVLQSDFEGRLNTENYGENPAKIRELQRVSDDLFEPTMQNALEMQFVLVPAGEFVLGIPDEGNSHELRAECPAHLVRISHPFYLGIHEVTQAQFDTVMRLNPSWHRPSSIPGLESSDEFPVEQVTWNQAVEFCQALSEVSEERAAGRNYRLPTEAEWEYACRAGQEQPYVWKSQRPKGDDSGDNAGRFPALPIRPVGTYPANAFGLHDMRGNVWEWTADWFDRDYYARSPIDDPQGPSDGYLKVVRGGDWTFTGESCKINYPMAPPWKSSRFVGFRIVCEYTALDKVQAVERNE